VLAVAGSPWGPAPGCDEADPALGVRLFSGSPSKPPSVVLATSLAAGGAGAWVVLGRGME
jgi:hypothetical protein